MINFFNHLLITIKKINHDYHSFCMQMTGQQLYAIVILERILTITKTTVFSSLNKLPIP